ncbi:MAG TPA: hypothetical protein ENI51_09590 [Candidatus Atribacteria bacterium]|nr:hypothetical protein [Candidatus Atribacteria bacterium]
MKENKKIESQVTFSDDKGNKIMVNGLIKGYAIRRVEKHGRIRRLDDSWIGKKILVILLE